MDAWGGLGIVMFGFPPLAILGVAFLVKLIGLLNDKVISWSRALLIGVVAFVLLLAAALVTGV